MPQQQRKIPISAALLSLTVISQSVVADVTKEVEDALVAYANELERHKALSQAVEADRLAVRLADERYQKGLTSFLDVLSSRQAFYQAQSNLVASEAKISSNLVALYKSMGGGWES